MTRFQRQTQLSEIGDAGQRAICNSSVLIVGAGGLGHPVLQYLAGMGVGRVGLIDGDEVSESNLHRQVLFSGADVGKNKAECLRDLYVARRDPVGVEAFPHFLDRSRALELFPRFDVIVDGSDNFVTKMLINDVCCVLKKPMVFGSISRFEGQISVFWPGRGPCYRCFVPDVPAAKIKNCAESGVVGALPGVIGAMEALETLKVLLKLKIDASGVEPLVGYVQIYDFLTNSFRKLRLEPRPGCRCLDGSFNESRVGDIALPVCHLSREGELLDVREELEWREFHLSFGSHWPLSKLEAGVFPEEHRHRRLVTICKSGVRAERAAQILRRQGFTADYSKEGIHGT